jgi:hypothetical protein
MLPNEIREKRILISVLNWGMGHVSRSIGLIDQLLGQNNSVFIACSIEQEEIYTQYFDTVEFIRHDGYPFEFQGKGRFGWDLTRRFSSLRKRLLKERNEVASMTKEHQINLVISDHRYGFRSDKVHSVFITHQFNLPVKWYQLSVNSVHTKLMHNFHSIWIMDYIDSKLAGKLSVSGSERKVEYIGPYSRFMLYDIEKYDKTIPTVLIASGPQIYAQQLVDQIIDNQRSDSLMVICERGINVPIKNQRIAGSWREQDKVILSAQRIIARSGYSTIMDVHFLKCDFQFIPTPGQAEQVYLANY